MESDKVYQDSYEYLAKLQKSNTTDNFSVDYKKLDQTSSEALKTAIDHVLLARRREVGYIVLKPRG